MTAETEEELIKRLNEWKDNVDSKGMRVSMNKTKVMISGERQKVRQKAVRWPCGVCIKGVGSNSLQCTSCQWWGAGMVICLKLGADLHMAQLIPLPLTVSCFSKIQIGFTFLVPAHPCSPGQRGH